MDNIMIDTELSYDNAEDENGVYGSEKVSNHLLGLFSHYEICDDKGKAYENQDDMLDDINEGKNLFLHNFKNYRDIKGLAYFMI